MCPVEGLLGTLCMCLWECASGARRAGDQKGGCCAMQTGGGGGLDLDGCHGNQEPGIAARRRRENQEGLAERVGSRNGFQESSGIPG